MENIENTQLQSWATMTSTDFNEENYLLNYIQESNNQYMNIQNLDHMDDIGNYLRLNIKVSDEGNSNLIRQGSPIFGDPNSPFSPSTYNFEHLSMSFSNNYRESTDHHDFDLLNSGFYSNDQKMYSDMINEDNYMLMATPTSSLKDLYNGSDVISTGQSQEDLDINEVINSFRANLNLNEEKNDYMSNFVEEQYLGLDTMNAILNYQEIFVNGNNQFQFNEDKSVKSLEPQNNNIIYYCDKNEENTHYNHNHNYNHNYNHNHNISYNYQLNDDANNKRKAKKNWTAHHHHHNDSIGNGYSKKMPMNYKACLIEGNHNNIKNVSNSNKVQQQQKNYILPETKIQNVKKASLNKLDYFKNNKNTKFTLKEAFGNIVEFSKDQLGSRFIQQELPTATSTELWIIFEEITTSPIKINQLANDVFGNYVIQKLFDYAMPELVLALIKALKPYVFQMTVHTYGCRVIQKALEVVKEDVGRELIMELDGHIMHCIKDQNGNHVIQKCIQCLDSNDIRFVYEAFISHVKQLSLHPFGCRIVQRAMENCKDDEMLELILFQIKKNCIELSKDEFGNYVVQHVLQYGKQDDKTVITRKIVPQAVMLSCQKVASNVIEKCLEYCEDVKEREELLNQLMGLESDQKAIATLEMLIRNQFGNFVILKILQIGTLERKRRIKEISKQILEEMKMDSKCSKQMISKIEKLCI